MIEDIVKSVILDQFSIGGYIFDAYLQISTTSRLRITEHPTEAGFSIADGAYLEPLEFVFDIGMSDTTLGKIPGQFQEGLFGSRSKKAFEVLREMQEAREPVTLVCRYGIYENIMVTEVSPLDDYKTVSSLRARVRLQQVIVTEPIIVALSSAPMITGINNSGTQNVTIVGGA